MLGNYIKLALRNLIKNRLYAAINVIGLTIGLCIYLFATLLADYELTHDNFFDKSDRIYTLGTVVKPEANLGIRELDAVYSSIGPLVEVDVPQVEAVARVIRRQYLVSVGDRHFYHVIKFTDSAFTKIFDFDYISGDERVLEDPSSIVLTETLAKKFFGDENPMGKTLSIDHTHTLTVGAIIKDLPNNSHFNTNLAVEGKLDAFAPLQAYSRFTDWPMEGESRNLSMGNNTYILLPPHLDGAWLKEQADGIYDRHVNEETKELMETFRVRNLLEMNTAIWDLMGMPVIGSIQVLAILVLIVACLNYTNLATAQTLRRTREVGLRKALGAMKPELLAQFLIESVTITLIAMFLSIAILEMVIPLFNGATGKVVSLDYAAILPWLISTTLIVGLLAGLYPAYLITRTNAIEALRDMARKGKGSTTFRSIMVGFQFTLSIFMLAGVTVMYSQNLKIEEGSNIFPKDTVINLSRVNTDEIRPRWETLRTEFKALDGVENVSLVSQIPFDQSNSSISATNERGNEEGEVQIHILAGDREFMKTYDMEVIAGRDLSNDVAADKVRRDEEGNYNAFELNVLLNELAIEKLGYNSPEEAIGKVFYDLPDEREPISYTIVGVVRDVNFLGLFNSIKPNIFYHDDNRFNFMSVRLKGGMIPQTVQGIERIWKEINPDFPIQRSFLSESFENIYEIFQVMNASLAGFALIALILALIGLFGLSAFMAEQRTREIGIRKVMGAKVTQIVRLLILQFSKPVLVSIALALPLAYLASGAYLNFFSDRISMPIVTILMTGILALGMSWITVALHATRVAHTNPIKALRYE